MGCASSNEPKDGGGGGGGGGAKSNGATRGGGGGGGGAGGDAGNENAAPEPAQPKQNPYLTLTPKDVFSLKMSYKGIRRSSEETGLTMFIKMFEANPDMKNYFEKFKDMDNEKLFKSMALQDHANTTMEMIDTLVTELDNADATHAKIKKLGADHKKRGIKEDHLKEMRNPFLKSVEQTLGDRYTDRMRNIYEVFIDYVIKTMIEGYSS